MALPQEKSYTFDDLLNWPDDVRVELIDGEVFMLSTPLRIHEVISRRLYLRLGNYLEGKKCEVYDAPFGVRLFAKKGDSPHNVDTVVVPDITVICDPDKLDDYGSIGAPDLVIEILSPSTQRHDRLTKYKLYQRAGVPEYWIVDPVSKTVQVLTLEEGQYYAPLVYTAQDSVPVGVLDDCRIDLSAVFADV